MSDHTRNESAETGAATPASSSPSLRALVRLGLHQQRVPLGRRSQLAGVGKKVRVPIQVEWSREATFKQRAMIHRSAHRKGSPDRLQQTSQRIASGVKGSNRSLDELARNPADDPAGTNFDPQIHLVGNGLDGFHESNRRRHLVKQ